MKLWAVWSEGFAATGERGRAHFHGQVLAETFKEACDKILTSSEDKVYYDPERMTYWGCRLFDNESDAKASFG